jgi:lipoprotein-releasing system permease protein
MIVKRGDKPQSLESILTRVKELAPEAKTFTPFVNLEGIIASGGKIAGVLIQGLDPKSVEKVLKIRPRVVQGQFILEPRDGVASALVGKALAKRFNLKVGDSFKIVLPTPSKTDSTGFMPKVLNFKLKGVMDLGKAEYDERYVITDLKTAQKFGEIGDTFTGIRIKMSDSALAKKASVTLAELGPLYFTMDWTDVNRNLFEAVKIERVVIFLVILIMVIAASFNISSNLFVSVLQKYPDISILRAMGFSYRDVVKVYVVQGLFFGVIGTVIGIALGLLLCAAFVIAQ